MVICMCVYTCSAVNDSGEMCVNCTCSVVGWLHWCIGRVSRTSWNGLSVTQYAAHVTCAHCVQKCLSS
jgi:hypothetical protein